MKIYVAAPWADKEQVPAVAAHLESQGHKITEKWWLVEDRPADDSIQMPDYLREHGELDRDGVLNADLVLVINSSKSEGKAVEQGIAIATNKPIIIVGTRGEVSKNVFHYLPLYKWVPSVEEAYKVIDTISWLLKEGERAK